MNQELTIFVLGVLLAALQTLLVLLLGIIIWEMRRLRSDLKEYVPDKWCRVMMREHDERLRKLEKEVEEK